MKKMYAFWVMVMLLASCATSKKPGNETFPGALIGQDETRIYLALGPPSKVLPAPNGGKVMLYEHTGKGMFLTPYKSPITYSAKRDISGNREGLILKGGVNTATNDPQYTIYQKEVSSLKVFLNKKGTCVRYEQDLPREILNVYNERFKHYSSDIHSPKN